MGEKKRRAEAEKSRHAAAHVHCSYGAAQTVGKERAATSHPPPATASLVVSVWELVWTAAAACGRPVGGAPLAPSG